jgi:hypothetical protein
MLQIFPATWTGTTARILRDRIFFQKRFDFFRINAVGILFDVGEQDIGAEMAGACRGGDERVRRRDYGGSRTYAACVHGENHAARIAVDGKADSIPRIESRPDARIPYFGRCAVELSGEILFKPERVFSRREPARTEHIENGFFFFGSDGGT